MKKIPTKRIPPEESLPAVSAAQVKQLRALNHDGQSVNTTTDALREMVGMDYSKLTEQVVPGEFWLSTDGVKKQVYVRTFMFTTALNELHTPIGLTLPWEGRVVSATGTSDDCKVISSASLSRWESASNSYALWHRVNFREGEAGIIPGGTKIILTVKYTKA